MGMWLGLFPYRWKQQSTGKPSAMKAEVADTEQLTTLSVLRIIRVYVQAVLLTAGLVPGIVFILFFLLNGLLWVTNAAGAVDFGVLLGLLSTWFGLSLPMTIAGAFFAFRLVRYAKVYSLRFPSDLNLIYSWADGERAGRGTNKLGTIRDPPASERRGFQLQAISPTFPCRCRTSHPCPVRSCERNSSIPVFNLDSWSLSGCRRQL